MTLAFIFGGVGFGEWLVLLAVILVVVGPKDLPRKARDFGRWYSKIRRVADDFRRQLMELDREVEREVARAEASVDEFARQAEEMERQVAEQPAETETKAPPSVAESSAEPAPAPAQEPVKAGDGD